MLDFMRRNAQSWGMMIALGIISFVFVFFLGGGGQIGGGPKPLVTVGDQTVSGVEYDMALRRNTQFFASQYGGRLTPELRNALDIPGLTLSQLVDGAVLRQESERIGLVIPDDAVRAAIQSIDAFRDNGQFSPQRYKQLVRQQNRTPSSFEAEMRQELLTTQLSDIVRRSVHVTEAEALERWRQQNRRVALSYIEIEGKDFTDEVTVDEAGMASFFEEQSETYRLPESVRVKYLEYTTDDFDDGVEITDEDIETEYEINKVDYMVEAQIGARHILKKIAEDASEEDRAAVRAAVEAIAKRLADGEDFAEIATAESEDTGSAASGGDLGKFGRGRMVESFEDAAFDLEVGETSDIVESQFGLHIIRVHEKQAAGQKSLDEVRDDITEKLTASEAVEALFDAANQDAAAIMDGAKVETIAEERGMKIEETAPFARGEIIAGIGRAPALVNAALSMIAIGDVTEAVKVGKDYYIAQLSDRTESYVPALDEVREDVESAYRKELALDMARATADEILQSIRDGKALADIAEERDDTVKDTEPFDTAGNFVPGLGNVDGLKDSAFAAKADGDALQRPFVHRNRAFVFVRKSLDVGNDADFDAVREETVTKLRTEKEQESFSLFLERLKRDTEIAYNIELVDRVLGRSVNPG